MEPALPEKFSVAVPPLHTVELEVGEMLAVGAPATSMSTMLADPVVFGELPTTRIW